MKAKQFFVKQALLYAWNMKCLGKEMSADEVKRLASFLNYKLTTCSGAEVYGGFKTLKKELFNEFWENKSQYAPYEKIAQANQFDFVIKGGRNCIVNGEKVLPGNTDLH